MYAELWLNERVVGGMEVKPSFLTNLARGRLRNIAYYSLTSARVWARITTPSVTEWETFMCEAPGEEPYHYGGVPGSFIHLHEPNVPSDFPPELLEREFFLHLDYAKRYIWQP